MNKIGLSCLSVLALAIAPMSASATTYRAAGTHHFLGNVTAKLGSFPSMVCAVDITVVTNNTTGDGHTPTSTPPFEHAIPATDNSHGHTAQVTNMTISGGVCGVATLTGTPYAITYSGGNLNISGVTATGPFGFTCSGNLSGPYNHATKSVTFTNATLPGNFGNCVFTGTLTASTLDIDATPS